MLLLATLPMFALSYHAVNVDKVTAAAMTAAYASEAEMEAMNTSNLQKIVDHYKSATVATAGILLSKKKDRDAMRNPGLFASEENYYYKRILNLVKNGIMPKLITVASKMVKQPQNAIYWGPYLFKTTENVEQLCKQFELVCTNGKLSFKDVTFLLINDDLRKIFDLAQMGANTNWGDLLDKLGDFGDGLTKEDIQEDFKNLGSLLASIGGNTIDSNLQEGSKIGKIFHMKPKEIADLYKNFKEQYDKYKEAGNVENILMQVIQTADADGVARLFKVDDYNITGYISNYIKEMQGQYYTQRWYIATDDIAEEVLATYSGRRGAERLESKLKEIVASNKSMDEKTAETQAVTQMNNAVSKFWNVMSDFLHIHYTSAEEVADRVLYEYTKGLYPLNYEEVAQQKGKTKPYYVSVEEKDNGRWHRPEVEQRAAYQRYGEMMADKLSLQLTYGDMPWIKSDKQVPCDLSKKAYQGMDSFMLALDAEKNAYTLPIYISKEDIQANNLLVKSDATSFPIIEEVGVTELYNIEQTNYPILHPKDYEELKLDSIASNRYKQSNELGQLLRKGAWQTAIAFDGKPSLASYSAKNDTIHVAPVQHYEKEQDFYRDLGMGLTRSTRKAEARKTSFESLSREELVSLVGSVILGQKNHFDVTTPQQTSMWKERLRKDPSYTKQVLSSADVASQIIIQRIDILKKGGSQDIDLRSSTPVEVDIDGNGIVESQENLAPDQKQSSNESQEQSDEVPRQEKRHMHR